MRLRVDLWIAAAAALSAAFVVDSGCGLEKRILIEAAAREAEMMAAFASNALNGNAFPLARSVVTNKAYLTLFGILTNEVYVRGDF